MTFGIRWKLIGLLLLMAMVPPLVLMWFTLRSVEHYAADRELVDALNDTQLSARDIELRLSEVDREMNLLSSIYFKEGMSPDFEAKLNDIKNVSDPQSARPFVLRLEIVDRPKGLDVGQGTLEQNAQRIRDQIAAQIESNSEFGGVTHWFEPWSMLEPNRVCIWADCLLAESKQIAKRSANSHKVLVAQIELTGEFEKTRHPRNFSTVLNKNGETIFSPSGKIAKDFPGWSEFSEGWATNEDWRRSGTRRGYYPGENDRDGADGFPIQAIAGLESMLYRQSKIAVNDSDARMLEREAKKYRDELRSTDGCLDRLEYSFDTRELRTRGLNATRIDQMEQELFARLAKSKDGLKLAPSKISRIYQSPMKTASICFVRIRLPGTDQMETRFPELTLASSISIEEIKTAASSGLFWPFVYFFAVSFCFGLFGLWVAWYFTQPLARMTWAAKELSKRVSSEDSMVDLILTPIDLPMNRKDEVGDLARAFSEMSQQVAQSKIELSQRVKERTQELELTNHKLQEQRDKAELADKAKTGFLATVSHEMKTPLHWLNGYASQLRKTNLTDRQERCVSKLFDGIELLKSLIGDVLDYQKILLGGMSIELESVDLAAFTSKLGESMESRATERNNKLIVECDVKDSFVTDPQRLTQIITNLLGNAFKFTENGEVRLRVTSQGGYIQFDVSDTGVGIPEEHLKNLFTPFEKRGAKQGNHDGTGLGLVICRELSRLLSGEVWVKSELGKGTTFSVVLPADLKSGVPSESGPGWNAFGGNLFNNAREGLRRVLIIDDDPHSTEILTEELKAANYSITSAEDGLTGIQKARDLQPDLITLDIVMPGMDGWEVLRQLKLDPVTREIPVVLVTVMGDTRKGLALGASGYLSKPFQPDELKLVLGRALGNQFGEVLIVDDDMMSREIAREALQSTGMKIVEAGDGEEALKRIAEHMPDALLLDLNMPRMNGFELLEQLRLRQLIGSMKIIIVSGRHLTIEERTSLAGNVAGFLDKSDWSEQELRLELRRQLKKSMNAAGLIESRKE